MSGIVDPAAAPSRIDRAPRWALCNHVVVADAAGRERIGPVADIASGGLMTEREKTLPACAFVTFDRLSRSRVRAQVRRALGRRFAAMIPN